MRLAWLTLFALVSMLLTACQTAGVGGGAAAQPAAAMRNPTLPASQAPATVRPGDNLSVQLQSIPDELTTTAQVDDEGHINLRYIGRIKASGLAPSELARAIAQAYVAGNFYKTIDVSVALAERFVYVGGEVARPGRVLWTPDLTLSSAITAAGGFSPFAKETAVVLSRDEASYTLDARLAARNPAEDRALLPGDRITVAKSAF